MHIETGHYLHHALEVASHYWAATLFVIGAVWGALIWAWNQYMKAFARHQHLEDYAAINTQQHEDIKKEVKGLRQDMNDKVHEILELLIKQGRE